MRKFTFAVLFEFFETDTSKPVLLGVGGRHSVVRFAQDSFFAFFGMFFLNMAVQALVGFIRLVEGAAVNFLGVTTFVVGLDLVT
jgi:hypothetical protein